MLEGRAKQLYEEAHLDWYDVNKAYDRIQLLYVLDALSEKYDKDILECAWIFCMERSYSYDQDTTPPPTSTVQRRTLIPS